MGPLASETPAVDSSTTMFMYIFEYSYDSTAVLKPNRSRIGSTFTVPRLRMYSLGGSQFRS